MHGAEAVAVQLKLYLHSIRFIALEKKIRATFFGQMQVHFVLTCFVFQDGGFIDP